VKLTVVGAGDSPPDRTRPAWLRALAPHLLFAVLLGAYMLLRAAVLPAVLGGDVSHGDNPIVGAGWVARVLTPFKVFFEYVRLLVAPAGLTIDYSLDHLKAASSFGDWQALTGLALFIGLLWAGLAAARRSPALAFFILAFFATYSVVSNIPFLSTVIMAERLVYLPSAFFLLALACVAEGLAHPAGGTAGLDLFAVTGEHECKRQDAKCKVQNGHASWLSATIRLRTRLRRDFVGHPPDRRSTRFRPGASLWRRVRRGFRPGLLLVAGAIAVVAVFAAGTVQRCREWRTPFSLYSAAVVTAPDSAKSHHLLANELRRRGEGEVALVHYGRSVRIDGDNFVARTNFARALASSGRYDEALEQLRVALTAAPGYGPAVQIVCGIFERTGRPPGAARVCFPDQAGR
jgi:tetratricopeptide (TPR) repeat protein